MLETDVRGAPCLVESQLSKDEDVQFAAKSEESAEISREATAAAVG